jgi:hypothetical protein
MCHHIILWFRRVSFLRAILARFLNLMDSKYCSKCMQRLSLSSFLKDTSANPSSKVFATCIPCREKLKKRRALQPLDPNKLSKRPHTSRPPLPSSRPLSKPPTKTSILPVQPQPRVPRPVLPAQHQVQPRPTLPVQPRVPQPIPSVLPQASQPIQPVQRQVPQSILSAQPRPIQSVQRLV